ncbi:aldo/keto reductase [Thomasclavelia ramosa]
MENKFGFGCMRLPMKNDEVDYDEFNQMIDLYMQEGFNYFDTAHGYLGGKSEIALRDCLVSRYPRESYVLTNKLTKSFLTAKKIFFHYLMSNYKKQVFHILIII